jgi:hypothetical protein
MLCARTGGGEPTRGGEIKLWQLSDGKLVKEFKNVHSDAVFALDFTPDGKYLASGAADKFARVVEVADQAGRVLAVGDVVAVRTGEVASALVTLPAHLPSASVLGATAGSVISAAAGIGVTTLQLATAARLEPAPPASPEQ